MAVTPKGPRERGAPRRNGRFTTFAAFLSFATLATLATFTTEATLTSASPSSPSSPSLLDEVPDAPLVSEPPPREDVARELRRVIGDPAYVFCHDPRRPLRGAESLCRYARDDVPACEAFARACASVRPVANPTRPFRLPRWAERVLEALFWMLLTLGAGYCLVHIYRHFRASRGEGPPDARAGDDRSSGLLALAKVPIPPVVDKDAERLLARAEAALAAADAPLAARLGHAALVRALESGGLLHVHAAATNGEHARALAGRPELRDVFRATAREVERSEFGREPPALDQMRQLLARIEPVVHRLVGVACVALLVLAAGCGAQVSGGAPDDAPEGTSVLGRLVVARGASFERRTRDLSELGDEVVDLVLVTASARLDEDAWAQLLVWVEEGGQLLLAGVPRGLPGRLGVTGPSSAVCAGSPHVTKDAGLPADSRIVGAAWPLELDASFHADVECGGKPLVASRALGEGRVVIVSEPDFLTNASLVRADHARVLLSLAREPTGVSLVDGLVSAGADSPYRAIANSGLGPLLVHGLVWLLLWALAKGVTFGVARDRAEPARRAFSEHVRAVGRLYARAGASRHALRVYAAWAFDRLHAGVGPTGSRRVLDLASAVATVTGRSEANVAYILAEAAAARDEPSAAPTQNQNQEQDLGVLRALHDIVHEVGGHR